MSKVKSLVYHGIKPPTKEDARLARKHLESTIALEKSKIKDHEQQRSVAKKAKHKKSEKYNDSHVKEHKKDIAEREASKKTINQIWEKLENLTSKK